MTTYMSDDFVTSGTTVHTGATTTLGGAGSPVSTRITVWPEVILKDSRFGGNKLILWTEAQIDTNIIEVTYLHPDGVSDIMTSNGGAISCTLVSGLTGQFVAVGVAMWVVSSGTRIPLTGQFFSGPSQSKTLTGIAGVTNIQQIVFKFSVVTGFISSYNVFQNGMTITSDNGIEVTNNFQTFMPIADLAQMEGLAGTVSNQRSIMGPWLADGGEGLSAGTDIVITGNPGGGSGTVTVPATGCSFGVNMTNSAGTLPGTPRFMQARLQSDTSVTVAAYTRMVQPSTGFNTDRGYMTFVLGGAPTVWLGSAVGTFGTIDNTFSMFNMRFDAPANATPYDITFHAGMGEYNMVCMGPDTRVEGDKGALVLISDIKEGDLVMTRGFGTRSGADTVPRLQPVQRVIRSAADMSGPRGLVRFAAGSFGGGAPLHDVVMTSGHPVLFADAHYDASALAASSLVAGATVGGAELLPDGSGLYNLSFGEATLFVAEGGVLAHAVPPSSMFCGMPGYDGPEAATNLLPYDDGREWHCDDGLTRHSEGGTGMWVV